MVGAAALMLSGMSHSLAAPTAAPPKASVAATDTAASLANASVYQDSLGNYYVVNVPAPGETLENFRIYVGDGKEMYLQAAITTSTLAPGWEASLWAPRADGNGTAQLVQQAGVVTLTCRYQQPMVLTLLPPAKESKIIATALFRKPLHDRITQVLARDEDGNYYFVDRMKDDDENRGFRVYVGPKGAMKQIPMKDVVSDSAGEIFATKSGEPKIITEAKTNTAVWRKGKKRTALTILPPNRNKYLIARELGVYGRMGYVCDEQ